MAVTQGLRQRDAVHGPQWRQARLTGVSMAGAAIAGVQHLAGPGQRRHGTADGVHAPDGRTS